MRTLGASNILPIVNENDISTTPEQLFGDNDQLSAHVAHYTDADILMILSDIDGYYEENPNAEIKDKELEQKHSPNNEFATGGIVTKLKAAQYMMNHNKEMFLCNGDDLTSAKEFLFENSYTKGTLFSTKNLKEC